ncbi:peptidase [Chromobacterium haemolyticum]|uniref:Peptidase n=1 Tax=Chromobacterium fluminis TaxID=3044269 RepID=A0ABX0L9B1_9NEIS|nr:type II toxin-antitoxin system RelE/ParE family toxin [Chromobacterium haemolyticum]NHR07370.1 peptidase [Chromobacterium haemolyticum]
MIKTFAHAGLKKFFETGSKKGIQPHHEKRLKLQLAVLDKACKLEDMGVPGWGLHPLGGDMAGHWSVTVNGNWRLTFMFDGQDAHVVNYQDYH